VNLIEVEVDGNADWVGPDTVAFNNAGRLSFAVGVYAAPPVWPKMLEQTFPVRERMKALFADADETLAGLAVIPAEWAVHVIVSEWGTDVEGSLALYPWKARVPLAPLVIAARPGSFKAVGLKGLWVVTRLQYGVYKVDGEHPEP
jgi:hypothetical protein